MPKVKSHKSPNCNGRVKPVKAQISLHGVAFMAAFCRRDLLAKEVVAVNFIIEAAMTAVSEEHKIWITHVLNKNQNMVALKDMFHELGDDPLKGIRKDDELSSTSVSG